MAKEKWVSTCPVPLDQEDWALLNETAQADKLPKTEIMRRGLRMYAADLKARTIDNGQHSSSPV